MKWHKKLSTQIQLWNNGLFKAKWPYKLHSKKQNQSTCIFLTENSNNFCPKKKAAFGRTIFCLRGESPMKLWQKKLCVWKACRRAFGSSIWFSLRSLWLTNSAVIRRRFFSKPSCIYVLKSKKMQYSTEDLTKITKNFRAKSKSYRLFLQQN